MLPYRRSRAHKEMHIQRREKMKKLSQPAVGYWEEESGCSCRGKPIDGTWTHGVHCHLMASDARRKSEDDQREEDVPPSNRKYQILSQLDDPSFIPPCVCMWIDGGASLVFLKGSSRTNYTKYDASTVNVVISRADIADAINIRCAQSILFCVCAIRKQASVASCPWRLSRKTKSVAHKHQRAELMYVLFCSFALSKLEKPSKRNPVQLFTSTLTDLMQI